MAKLKKVPNPQGPVNPRGALIKARVAMEQKKLALAGVPVELQVTDADHARSPEVYHFAMLHLASGGTWEVLRRKLGLGPAYKDHRWRIVRDMVCEGLVPKTEEDALRSQASGRMILIEKLEEMMDDLEGLSVGLSDKLVGDKIMLQNLLKLKMENLKIQLEENSKAFDAYIDLQKVKSLEKRNQGASFVIQNNYHIARPGDQLGQKDVTEETIHQVSALIEQTKGLKGEEAS